MARKTFISYKYSEAQRLRDDIIEALGDDAKYYNGETSDSPDLTDTSTENIKKHLKDMIYETSVTIVIISPHMKESKWIDWEIEYSLKEIVRNDRTSRINGIVGVIMKYNDGYNWFITKNVQSDGHETINYNNEYLYPIIYNNHYNSNPPIYYCKTCKSFDQLDGSYISYIKEEDFLNDPQKYIENAYNKSKNTDNYDITKTR
ncbi:TIR domain-containing protein [Thermoanaerobacterium thermosaccharolyticum]|uniref:TIR domain-containing protein n=1 Tax=Thermoanaerobacterium thermosaccharolyticum TaxID=1517 RepID=UPI00177CB249|nr:TIR domain-containing protein [Thermoanaerobacterium thermosaccharolyticum]MBE0067697.1 hypothetical protein [Thermoanaerobacterium thermosaccharolyticum]MBE0228520.1 hypothetical protein [Thermoanaerobacterium thermosaccharolyticum]